MSNVEKLKKYLIDDGYLLSDISNGKVIILSGEWGSGKTHFWKNEIEPKLDKSIYISLYGKKSINDIENEILSKSFFSEFSDEDVKNISTFGNITKNIVNIMAPKIGEKLEDVKTNIVNNFGKNYLRQGGLLCFDDFERKSKNVDLNDLFGFITQLALNFNCKIILILNSDVFEGKEKDIFTNVKEKTVSKYLKFLPTCRELFEIIFQDEKYKSLTENCDFETIQKTFEEVGVVNARILIQVLDNLLEWYEKNMDSSTFFIRYFVLVNINFLLNHHVAQALLYVAGKSENKNSLLDYILDDDIPIEFLTHSTVKSDIDFMLIVSKMLEKFKYDTKILENLRKEILLEEKQRSSIGSQNPDNGEIILKFIDENQSLVKSLHFLISFGIHKYAQSDNQIEVDKLNDVNNFIETGIL